jgi:quinol monooxygenase YgiN
MQIFCAGTPAVKRCSNDAATIKTAALIAAFGEECMILVTGDVHVRADAIDEALMLSLAHVTRARKEPGCLSHDVARNAHNLLHLMFVERWDSKQALLDHVRLPESQAFGRRLAELSTRAPVLDIYDATLTRLK